MDSSTPNLRTPSQGPDKTAVSTQDKINESVTPVSSSSEDTVHFKLDARILMATVVLLISYQGAFFLLTLTAPILSYINADLGPVSYANWVIIAYSMTNGVVIAVSGRMMDIWGRRYIMIFGQCLGVVGCIVGCTAKSVGAVIAAVTIGGCGAGIQQQTTACLGELFPRRLRALSSSTVAFSTLLSGVFGTPIAYAFVKHLSWRWSFYTTLMANCIGLIGTIFFYFPPTYEQKNNGGLSKWQQVGRFDWFGLTIFIGALVSLLYGVNSGGTTHPWKSGATIAPIIVGAVGLFLFGIWESSPWVKDPFIPRVLAKDIRGFVAVIVTVFVAGMLLYSLLGFWPVQVQTMYTSNLDLIGWMGMTPITGTCVGSLILGLLFAKIGHARIINIVSVTLMTVFMASMAAMTPETKSSALALSLIGSIFVGWVQLVSVVMILVRVDDEYIGIAFGLSGTARLVGGAIATAIYGSIISNKVTEVLPGNVSKAVLPLGFPQQALPQLLAAVSAGSQPMLAKVPGLNPEILSKASYAVKESYAQGFKLMYLVSIAFGACAIVAASFTKNVDDKMTDEGNAQLNSNHLIKAATVHEENV